MSSGKLAAQAGHAFLDAFHVASRDRPEIATEYHNGRHGTKVVLGAPNLTTLMRVYEQAQLARLPCALITDSGHVFPPHFDGSPVITALGIGPVLREEIHSITKRLQLVR